MNRIDSSDPELRPDGFNTVTSPYAQKMPLRRKVSRTSSAALKKPPLGRSVTFIKKEESQKESSR